MDKREVNEIIAPNLDGNPWPVPMGYPVVLADGKAYWFACAAAAERTQCLLDGIDKVKELETKCDTGESAPSDFLKANGELAATALALQYNDDTVNYLVSMPAITSKESRSIIASILGHGPGYEVIVKKK